MVFVSKTQCIQAAACISGTSRWVASTSRCPATSRWVAFQAQAGTSRHFRHKQAQACLRNEKKGPPPNGMPERLMWHPHPLLLAVRTAHTAPSLLLKTMSDRQPHASPAGSQSGTCLSTQLCQTHNLVRQTTTRLTSWESKWRMPSTRREASRTAVKASARRESKGAPAASRALNSAGCGMRIHVCFNFSTCV